VARDSTNDKDRRAFLKKLRRGDAGAFREWVRQTRAVVEAVLVAMVHDADTAMDLTQQVYIRAYGKLGSVRNMDRLGPWLVRLTRNIARDHLRRQAVRKREFERFKQTATPWYEPGETGGEEADRRDRVRELVDELPEEQREVVLLRYYGGKSYEEMATLLGVPLTTVDGRMRQARRKLAEWLRKEEG
jgi:RNA polymerase sigma-70 factor (ECF subfamily)